MSHNDNNILQEQIRLVFKQLPGIIFIPAIGALLLSAMHWGKIPDNNIFIWVSIVLLTSSGSTALMFFAYRKYQYSNISTKFWANSFNVLGLFSGLGWGSSAYFIYAPDNIVLQMVLILVLFSASSLVALTMTAYRPVFYAVTAPMLIPVAIRLMFENDFLHIALSITAITYIVALFIFHFYVNQGFVDSIRLWFEKNDLARELKLRSIESEKENLAKSRFLAAASHDLRQPLVAQDLLLDSLKNSLADNNHDELFSKLKLNISSLHKLFNELVEVSKIDTGNIPVKKVNIDLDDLMIKVKNQFLPIAQDKNIDLSVQMYASEVYTDINLLERILQNIISNAIKYTHHGEINVTQDKVGNA